MSTSSRPWRLAALMFSLAIIPLQADVVRLANGGILIGSLVGPVAGGVSYETFGTAVTIPIESILRTEKNLDTLSTETVEIILKDRSVIRGKIVDFDPEIGLFVDIAFGTLTIPGGAVDRVVDPQMRTRYAGSPFALHAGGGAHWPLAYSAEYFGVSWQASAGADWALPFMRGLYAGLNATVYGTNYLPDAEVTYTLLSLQPEISIKYLAWRMKEGLLNRLVPYASFAAGPAYMAVNDPASYPSRYGSLSADLGLAAGIEIAAFKGFGVRLEATASAILQAGAPFLTAGANLSIGFEP